MSKSIEKAGRGYVRWISRAFALAVICLGARADAATQTASVTVKQINFNDFNGVPQLAVLLSDNAVYVANVVSGNECTGIPSPSIEVVKQWQSMFSAALLSGKSVRLWYTDCGSPTTHWINEVDLYQ